MKENNELIKEVIKIIDTEIDDVRRDHNELTAIDQDKVKAMVWSLNNIKRQILKLTILDNTTQQQPKQDPGYPAANPTGHFL